MDNSNILNFIKEVLKNMPADWLNLTTHRLDIYNEELAKPSFWSSLKPWLTIITLLKIPWQNYQQLMITFVWDIRFPAY